MIKTFELIGNSTVKVGSPVEYSEVHQFGGGNNIPERPMLPSLKVAEAVTTRLVKSYINELKRV